MTIEAANRTIKNFKKHLVPGGLLIIALYKPSNTKKEISIHTGKINNIEAAKINHFSIDKATSIETSNFITLIKKDNEIDFSIENNHKMKIFQINEIIKLFRINRFKDIKVYNNFTKNRVKSRSKYPIIVAKNI